MFSHFLDNPLAYVAIAVGVFQLLKYLDSAGADRPVLQAAASIVLVVPFWAHELGHAVLSLLVSGKARIHLYSVSKGSDREDGLRQAGATECQWWGPLSEGFISAGPSLVLWPLAVALMWTGFVSSALGEAFAVGVLLWAGRLSITDKEGAAEFLDAAKFSIVVVFIAGPALAGIAHYVKPAPVYNPEQVAYFAEEARQQAALTGPCDKWDVLACAKHLYVNRKSGQ